MTTDELLARIDAAVSLTTPVECVRLLDGQLVVGIEGKALTQREIREFQESQLVA